MSKTPYEIRLELLKLANEVLTVPIHAARDHLISEFHTSRETFVNEDAPRNPLPFPILPTFPNTDAIIAEAEKLNNFVSKS